MFKGMTLAVLIPVYLALYNGVIHADEVPDNFAFNKNIKSATVTNIKSVYDGDTFRAYINDAKEDVSIRIRGVDTPEIKGLCPSEIQRAIEAREYLIRVLKNGRTIKLSNLDTDKYGRTLADVSIDNNDVAVMLIDSGLGRKWRGRRESWCK